MAQQNTNVYILKLTGGKYYIGKTVNVDDRYAEHCAGIGSAWTTLYRPLGIEKIIKNADSFDEDKWTKRYMAEKGIEHVRGGSYSAIILDEIQIEALKRELQGASDKCFKCGSNTHFASNCHKSLTVYTTFKKAPPICSRCGRYGHDIAYCYARRDHEGNSLDDDDGYYYNNRYNYD